MNNKNRQPHDIPFDNLAEGIQHGPYPDIPATLVAHYFEQRQHSTLPDTRTDEQYLADLQSEWQYDQHCAAVEEACVAERISPAHALYMMDDKRGPLRRWFIGYRQPD